MASESKTCNTCRKVSVKACGRCGRVSYCNETCQRKDWKEHKDVCFPVGAKCERCTEIIDDHNLRQCNVPHPVHLLSDLGGSFGGGECTSHFSCKACEKSFTRSAKGLIAKANLAPITKGPKFCYSGPHTIKPLKAHDMQRVCNDILVLTVGPNLQEEIDDIPNTMPDIRILTIQSTGLYESSINPTLEVSMPKLETLKLNDVAFSEIFLTPEYTPSIKELFMQNVPEECDITVRLPELEDFSMHYYGPADNDDWIHEMLSTATKLRSFDSYKLRVGPELSFASNHLEYIRLHRAEMLYSLSVYAPKLQELSLQGCYGLDGNLTIMDSHPKFKKPRGQPSTFLVNTTNACISESIRRILQSNPRALWDDDDESDDDGFGSFNPLERHFAQMRQMMG